MNLEPLWVLLFAVVAIGIMRWDSKKQNNYQKKKKKLEHDKDE